MLNDMRRDNIVQFYAGSERFLQRMLAPDCIRLDNVRSDDPGIIFVFLTQKRGVGVVT